MIAQWENTITLKLNRYESKNSTTIGIPQVYRGGN